MAMWRGKGGYAERDGWLSEDGCMAKWWDEGLSVEELVANWTDDWLSVEGWVAMRKGMVG